jgi:hypothetical protein
MILRPPERIHFSVFPIKKSAEARHQWFMPIILTTKEPEIRRIVVRSQPGQIVLKTLSQKNPSQKKGWCSE